jgi:stage II sporulation protein GA (sporulation sigma-E factor processing peptidase)
MIIYIEYVIIDNMAFDCLILFLATLTLKMKARWWRIVLGGVVGTMCAFLSVYVDGFVNILLKITCAMLMSFVCCGINVRVFWHILLTVAYTFAMGGAILGLFFLSGTQFDLAAGLNYDSNVPMGVYLVAAALVAFIIYFCGIYVRQKKRQRGFLTKVTLTLDTAYTLIGFCDSGNNLVYNNTPVCFAVGDFKKRIKEFVAKEVLKKNTVCISYRTMAGEAQCVAVKAELTKGNRTTAIYLALSKVKGVFDYDLLLNSVFSSEGNDEYV